MNYTTVSLPAFTVAGISARVSNDRPEGIGQLWQQFYAQGIAAKVPNKKSGNIYSLYIDYESDHTKPYTLVIGCEVKDASSLPAGLVSKDVPAAKYAVIPANGKQPDSVIAAWQQVYSSGLARTYSGDFDLYVSKGSDPSDQDVDLYVAIR
ncbi:MAG: GyrI-like domain-containing protein [Terriglobales bacterium]|jgi:predicted transcriptional regulator YdeE